MREENAFYRLPLAADPRLSDPLPLLVALMCPETFPTRAKSVRPLVIHDGLKPPQTTGRRADLVMRHAAVSFEQKYQLRETLCC